MKIIRDSIALFAHHMFLLLIVVLIPGIQVGYAYEVTSHQMMAARTIAPAKRVENLQIYLDTFDLRDKKYSRSFQNLAQSEFNDKGIRVAGRGFQSLIEAGSIIEDRTEPGRSGLDGRFFHHFYDPINNQGLNLPVLLTQPTARDWGFNGAGEQNDHTWQRALDYFEQAVTDPSEDERTEGEEMLFVTLGHLVHLIQDSAQPSHTRNDGHGGYGTGTSLLETVGNRRLQPANLVPRVRVAIDESASNRQSAYNDFFDNMATFSNGLFFSDETIFETYAEPSTGSTTLTTLPNETKSSVTETYIASNSLMNSLKGTTRLARRSSSFFGLSSSDTLASTGDVVILDNAEQLMAKAVSTAEGLLNYFFRAQLEIALDVDDSSQLVVRNVSDTGQLLKSEDATLSNGRLQILYETADGRYLTLVPETTVTKALAINGELRIDSFGEALNSVRESSLPDSMRIGEEGNVIAVFRGNIGSEEGVVATRASFVNKVSILLSYDVSGSVSSADLAQAVTAGRRLITLLSVGEENRASLHAFSSSANIRVPFTNDLAAVDSGLSRLSPGGSTALNDAIFLAGTSSQTEANASSNFVVLALFTDGNENSSSKSVAQAVAETSRIGHPEIDEVILVFIGSAGDSGSTNLSNIAAQAGRRFGQIDEFDALSRELLQAIQRANEP
ncbi:Uncharacterised protein [Halioglobus japonicus]|nr:Uncharacterised protein [Halioglobus japonicus]